MILLLTLVSMTDQVFLKRLGSKIAQTRKAKGKTLLDICVAIEMEKSNLSAIENGRQNATSLTLKKIAEALNVEVKDFFTF
jgi:transcriptional regulator with XRE-family HTH domain